MDQASLVIRKIQTEFMTNANILRELVPRNPIHTQGNALRCELKNGSYLEARTVNTARGLRAKVIVVDEAPEVTQDRLSSVVEPIRNYKRMSMTQLGLEDYQSKIISITSACLKSNYFYTQFCSALHDMAMGDRKTFACALDYKAAIRAGISDAAFFEEQRRRLPESAFAMEYESIFLGAEQGAVFPYELTEKCRVLEDVETAMPVKSTSDYVIGIDLATSASSHADNAVITVIKLAECEDGGYIKRLVYIRSFHGKRLDYLATETRKLLIKFPRVIKIVFDHRGLGDAFPRFFSQPWVDPETHKEYPPLVLDTELSMIHDAVPLLHPVVANASINQQLVSSLAVALEQKSLLLPIPSRRLVGDHAAAEDADQDDKRKKYSVAEKAIFIEADALQIEMGNIVGRVGTSGAVLYDVAKANQHKDRYSALAMGVWYISTLEDERRKKINGYRGNTCVGVVLSF